jgi:hypothetical protein
LSFIGRREIDWSGRRLDTRVNRTGAPEHSQCDERKLVTGRPQTLYLRKEAGSLLAILLHETRERLRNNRKKLPEGGVKRSFGAAKAPVANGYYD